MHSRAFRWFSAAPLVFEFLGFLPLQLNQIWRIFCAVYGEEADPFSETYVLQCKTFEVLCVSPPPSCCPFGRTGLTLV